MADAVVDPAVFDRHPDYVAVLISATGLIPGPGSEHSEALLLRAEEETRASVAGGAVTDLPEVMAWREAYLGFGVKHREARSSIESLLRRVDKGLPRIDRLTDTYNAISVIHRMPIGGEDLHGYAGAARLVVAAGDEPFDTVADGVPTTHIVAPGEIAWRDDRGVTCRRWNWRQCVRTRLTEQTTDALFTIDGLGPQSRERAEAAAEALVHALTMDSPTAAFASRTLPD